MNRFIVKNFNWLVKLLFYKHNELNATSENTTGDEDAIFYKVGFVDQIHANLCTAASENMLYHFGKKPIATMVSNPRGILEGEGPKEKDFPSTEIDIADLKETLHKKGPFILSLPLKYGCAHSVVAIGFANNHLIYHDPMTGSNKMISTSELRKITSSESISIAQPNFLSANDLKEKRLPVLDEKPANIPTKKYASFFTLDKMSDEANQCQAIKNFLSDYAKNSLWTINRNHKQEVRKFLEDNKDVVNLSNLMENMTRSLSETAGKTKGELFKRLLTINKMCGEINKPEEHDTNELTSRSDNRL